MRGSSIPLPFLILTDVVSVSKQKGKGVPKVTINGNEIQGLHEHLSKHHVRKMHAHVRKNLY